MNVYSNIAVLSVFCIFLFLWLRPKKQAHSNSLSSLFDGAVLFLNETPIQTEIPVKLKGRVDQVFKLRSKQLLIVDTKNRSRPIIYPSDIVQVSVYSLILVANGHSVLPFALIRFPAAGMKNKPVYKKVRLLPAKTIVHLHQRYLALKNGHKKAYCRCGKHRK